MTALVSAAVLAYTPPSLRRTPAVAADLPEILRPKTRAVLLGDARAASPADAWPFERVGYGWTRARPDALSSWRGELIWFDARDLGPVDHELFTVRLTEAARSGKRVVVHDPTLALAVLAGARHDELQPVGTGAIRRGNGRVPLRAGEHAHLLGAEWRTKGIADPVYPSHGGFIRRDAVERAAVILVTRASDEVVAFCRPVGAGAIVYSTIALREFLRGRQESRLGAVLRDRYAQGLVVYAAWGACNDDTRVVPLRVDVIPGDEANRVTRRGIPVTILSRSDFDVVAAIDPRSLRFGLGGREDSLHRCAPVDDQDGDGRSDLQCVFRFRRMGTGYSGRRVILTGTMRDGVRVYSEGSIRPPALR